MLPEMQPLYSRQKLCFKTCRCMNRNNTVCFIFILASSSIYIVYDDKHWLSLRFAGSIETILKKKMATHNNIQVLYGLTVCTFNSLDKNYQEHLKISYNK